MDKYYVLIDRKQYVISSHPLSNIFGVILLKTSARYFMETKKYVRKDKRCSVATMILKREVRAGTY